MERIEKVVIVVEGARRQLEVVMMRLAPLQRHVPSAKVALVACWDVVTWAGVLTVAGLHRPRKLRGHQGGHSQDGRHAHGGDHGHMDLLGSLYQVTRDGRDLTGSAPASFATYRVGPRMDY